MAYQALRDEGYSPKAAWKKLRWRPRPQGDGDGDHDSWEELQHTKEYAVENLGMTRTLAEVIAYENDEGAGWWGRQPIGAGRRYSEESRYRGVLEGVQRELAATPRSSSGNPART